MNPIDWVTTSYELKLYEKNIFDLTKIKLKGYFEINKLKSF